MPFGTILENDDLFPLKRLPSPPPIRITDEELLASRRKNESNRERPEEFYETPKVRYDNEHYPDTLTKGKYKLLDFYWIV